VPTPRPRLASAPTEPRPVAGFLVSDYIGDSAKHAANGSGIAAQPKNNQGRYCFRL
jgi:hypothetical protein